MILGDNKLFALKVFTPDSSPENMQNINKATVMWMNVNSMTRKTIELDWGILVISSLDLILALLRSVFLVANTFQINFPGHQRVTRIKKPVTCKLQRAAGQQNHSIVEYEMISNQERLSPEV